MSDADYIEADVTFPGCAAFPYVMNFVTFNSDSNHFEVVARVITNRLTQFAYKTIFDKVFAIVTNKYPSFDHGQSVACWILDFSVPQRDALISVLGSAATIRGCNVHYQRNARKVALKVCREEKSIQIFLKIAYKLPQLQTENEVMLAFDILKGEKPFADEEAQEFLLGVIGLNQEEASINNETWTSEKTWVDWWSKPRTLKMFTKALKEMTDADWNLFPDNTNAVESQNKVSQVDTNKFLNAVRHYYVTDKNSIKLALAAAKGIGIGLSQEKRKAINAQRQSSRRNKRPKLRDNHKESSGEPEEEEEEDPYIGQPISVYTKAARGSKYNWRPAKVELKNSDGSYMIKYSDGNTAIVKDLMDKKKVKFRGPMEGDEA